MWKEYTNILRSKVLRNVLLALRERPKLVSEIAVELKYNYLSTVSQALKELGKAKLVKCMTPNAPKSRVYMLTKIGGKLANKLSR